MTLNLAQSRATIETFIDRLHRRAFDDLPTFFTEDAEWIVLANTTRANWGGKFRARDFCKRAAEVVNSFESWSYIARDIIVDADGKLAVADLVGKGRGPGPLQYDNNYMMKFTFDEKSGKFSQLKETLDCYEVEIMLESMEAYSKESNFKGIEGVVSYNQ